VGVGECGLDYDRMFSPRPAQLAAFEAQVELAAELALPLFVHCRERDADKGPPLGAYADAMAVLARRPGLPAGRVCVHCFTGGRADLAQLVAAGYMVGLTGASSLDHPPSRPSLPHSPNHTTAKEFPGEQGTWGRPSERRRRSRRSVAAGCRSRS
jgi:TatD DNase family protein